MRVPRRYLLVLIATGLTAQVLLAANPPGIPAPGAAGSVPTVRTNRPGIPAPGRRGPATNAAAAIKPPVTPSSGTNAAGTNVLGKASGLLDSLVQEARSLAARPGTLYPILAGAICVLLVIALFASRRKRARTPGAGESAPVVGATRPGKARIKKIHSSNVLQFGAERREIWQFDAGSNFTLSRHQVTSGSEPIPAKLTGKSWASLFQPKLNIAWVPPEHVFLRVVQLPQVDFEETLSMVEFQLEKLSPMPVAQCVWTMRVLPHPGGSLQTVIVTIVARSVVEDFLGKLESEGYLADRLELPVLDLLEATPGKTDGAWVFPEAVGGKGTGLVAWWYGGVLQNVGLVTLGETANLKEQLVQMAWAGEMEGWLSSPPLWHLVAEGELAALWDGALRAALDQAVEVIAPLSRADLARRTAARASVADPRATLLPPEFSLRYHQQFVDRLWIRGLGAILGLYMVGVAIYFVALGFVSYQTRKVESRVAERSTTYTNAIALKAQTRVLKDRQELRFAALDCWSLTANLMPDGLSLDSMNFSDGRRLMLSGTAPSDKVADLINFEAAMRNATNASGTKMFDPVKGDNLSYHANPGAANVTWNFALELKRADTP